MTPSNPCHHVCGLCSADRNLYVCVVCAVHVCYICLCCLCCACVHVCVYKCTHVLSVLCVHLCVHVRVFTCVYVSMFAHVCKVHSRTFFFFFAIAVTPYPILLTASHLLSVSDLPFWTFYIKESYSMCLLLDSYT